MGKFELPSLILHVDEIIENSLEIAEVIRIEKSIINIIQKELEAEKNNCQIIWVKSKIICSNYKIFGELKFRDKETRNIDKSIFIIINFLYFFVWNHPTYTKK